MFNIQNVKILNILNSAILKSETKWRYALYVFLCSFWWFIFLSQNIKVVEKFSLNIVLNPNLHLLEFYFFGFHRSKLWYFH